MDWPRKWASKAYHTLWKYSQFVGPGIMVSIAYMDPGNYSTDVAAGALSQYWLLFVVLLSNLIAMYLQALAIKLGTVTGNDLAVATKQNFNRWLVYGLYVLAEAAIICTDIAEVIGTAIALNILLHIPLMAGVVLTIVDVILVLLAYRPGKGMATVRIFEYVVALLVLGVVICFAVLLSRIPPQDVGLIFRGYLPSHHILEGSSMYQACGILGATVMPHSLYLGSGLVRPRVRDYDIQHGIISGEEEDDPVANDKYRPSMGAISYALKYSIFEVVFSLSTFALFVNSAILIVAGATMYGNDGAASADLYGIHDILSQLLSKVAGTVFMIALLFSGQSAGIICTIAGQIVSEGHLNWTIRPWLRRIITRLIAIVPCLIVAGSVGRNGLNATLNASQVALSILLPFLTAPLIYLTCLKRVMTVNITPPADPTELAPAESSGQQSERAEDHEKTESATTSYEAADMSNNWLTTGVGVAIWLFIAVLNVYLIVHLAMYGN